MFYLTAFPRGALDSRPMPELTWTTARARPSYRTRTPTYIVLSLPTSPSPHALNTLQTPLPPLNNPTPEQTFLAKRREHPTTRSRPARHIPHPYTHFFSARHGPCWDLGRVLILPTVERTLPEMEVDLARRTGDAPTLTSPVLGSAPSPTQHEVLRTFECLSNPNSRTASSGTLEVIPGPTSGKRRRRGLRHRAGVGFRRRIQLMLGVGQKMGKMQRLFVGCFFFVGVRRIVILYSRLQFDDVSSAYTNSRASLVRPLSLRCPKNLMRQSTYKTQHLMQVPQPCDLILAKSYISLQPKPLATISIHLSWLET